MSVVLYSRSCEGCSGNHALTKMKAHCEKKDMSFEERRTILWVRYKEEAEKIMELNPELELPFFYSTESGRVLSGNSFTPLEQIDQLIKADIEASEE